MVVGNGLQYFRFVKCGFYLFIFTNFRRNKTYRFTVSQVRLCIAH